MKLPSREAGLKRFITFIGTFKKHINAVKSALKKVVCLMLRKIIRKQVQVYLICLMPKQQYISRYDYCLRQSN